MSANKSALTDTIRPGQRWMSEAEPELGLGLVLETDARSVVLAFVTADETRRYAVRTAPLRRVRFAPGDALHTSDGAEVRVDTVEERAGLLVYHCRARRGTREEPEEVPEAALSDRIALTGPRERLLAGRIDAPARFDLRLAVLHHLHRARRSPVRGFVGPRLELLPHQFYIASEVTGRHAPRVLLADETGLGKTIEACLIINRLLLSGRAARVLILVPDALVHQWLVELRRRFNLPFAVFDAERCAALADDDPDANAFSSEQLVLAGLGLVTESAARMREAAAAGWDILVVDEAHHLEWTRAGASPAYEAVEAIAACTPGLLLLSATPERLGEEGHFARLRLLDPDRYGDFERWQRESEGYREVVALGERLIATIVPAPTKSTSDGDDATASAAPLRRNEIERLARVLQQSTAAIKRRLASSDARGLLDELIDRHGPGRVMFRNTRAAMTSFPERRVALQRLTLDAADRKRTTRLAREIAQDIRPEPLAASPGNDTTASENTRKPDLAGDPRIEHLLDLLAAPEPAKLLVLCRSAAKAVAIKTALDARMKVKIALFHEDMTLVQRDRSAAWFADASGARLLVASEIGSEGRNFQHAHVLLMFDLPLDPDLVEQRIGRLDRIGQRGTVHIYVPYVSATGQEALARWHHEGVDAFARPTLTARPLLERFGARVRTVIGDETTVGTGGRYPAAAVDALVADTAVAADELATRVEQGRDRLLEMASLRPDAADALIDEIARLDHDLATEELFLQVLDHFHVYAEEISPRSYLLNPDGVRSEEFPALSQGETAVTFARETALVREDLRFVTADHPLPNDAMELLLASESGNGSFALTDTDGPPGLWLEAVFVLESVAPPRLHVDRFLPPTPVRVVVDQRLTDRTGVSVGPLVPGRGAWLTERRETLTPLLAKMNERCAELAEARAETLRREAVTLLTEALGGEIRRLRALALVDAHVRPAEIAATERERTDLSEHIASARLRPDALRLVWRGPHRDGVPAARPR